MICCFWLQPQAALLSSLITFPVQILKFVTRFFEFFLCLQNFLLLCCDPFFYRKYSYIPLFFSVFRGKYTADLCCRLPHVSRINAERVQDLLLCSGKRMIHLIRLLSRRLSLLSQNIIHTVSHIRLLPEIKQQVGHFRIHGQAETVFPLFNIFPLAAVKCCRRYL